MITSKHLIKISTSFIAMSLILAMTIPMNVYAVDEIVETDKSKENDPDFTVENTQKVITNTGYVYENEGEIVENRGEVENNNSLIDNNHGMINNNSDSAIVTNNYFDGCIAGSGTVENNYGGLIEGADVTITNRYWYVTDDISNITAQYDTNFITSPDANDNHKYLKVNEDGNAFNPATITLIPSDSFQITANDVPLTNGVDANNKCFKYSLTRQDDGSYALVLHGVNGNICIIPDIINLNVTPILQNPGNINGLIISEDADEDIGYKATNDDSDESTSIVAEATSVVSIGGVVLKSQISGAYSVKGFAGFAIRMGSDAIRTMVGISGTPFVRAYDITPSKSPAAFASINGAAASVGATVLGAINVDLGQMNGGKFSSLPGTVAVPATLGVANAGGRTLAVVKVLPGGAFEILQDTDDNPMTVTFPVTGGLCSYAVIAY